MKKFDTKVQYIKYEVLREVARHEWKNTLLENILDIPKNIVPEKTPSIRCCAYKERAIIAERVKIAIGTKRADANPIEVIETACEECPVAGHEVTESCRGCIAHRCAEVCRFNAIVFDEHHVAHIDKSKCVECGQCAKTCPYSAIVNRKRPCQNVCKVKAISMNEENVAIIDYEKCIACGACVYQCPFGAIMDRTNILLAIDLLKRSEQGHNYKLYAIVAPAISSQFTYAKSGQVITGLKKLGFHTVVEAALGADMVARSEARELAEKGFLISSCCPSFISYMEKEFPDLLPFVSGNLSPMALISKHMKEHSENTKIVFIGPCTAKKMEAENAAVKPYVDCVLTFEELQALFDSYEIDITTLEEEMLDNASYYGRVFARSGGLTEAVGQAIKEQKIEGLELNPCVCDGIDACRIALQKKRKNLLDANFIEGMACEGGCIGGFGCLTHSVKDKLQVDTYGREAMGKSISDAVSVLNNLK